MTGGYRPWSKFSRYTWSVLNRYGHFEFDAYAWSFEVGVVKPDHRIYSTIWQSLALSPGEVLMVGDTYEADCLGPRRVGMHAIHLARNLASPDPRFLRSLSDLPSYLARQAPPSVPQ